MELTWEYIKIEIKKESKSEMNRSSGNTKLLR